MYIFAGTTLHQKLVREYSDLPESAHASFRDALLGHVHRFRAGPQPVRTQLARCVAVLCALMTEWKDPLGYVLSCLIAEPRHAEHVTKTYQSDPSAHLALLDILTLVP